MKKYFAYIFTLLVFAAPLMGGAFLEYFSARSENDNIVVEWKTGSEQNLKQFEIQRRSSKSPEWLHIETVAPEGSFTRYSYIDRSAYKTTDNVYMYRLKIIDASGQIGYSKEIEVTHSVSNVKRTWGSIKAMFR